MTHKIQKFEINLIFPIFQQKKSQKITRYLNKKKCDYFFFEKYPERLESFFDNGISTDTLIFQYLLESNCGVRSNLLDISACQSILEKIFSENEIFSNLKKSKIRILTTFNSTKKNFLNKTGDRVITLEKLTGNLNSNGFLRNYSESLQGFREGDSTPICTYKKRENYLITNQKIDGKQFLSFHFCEHCEY